MKLLAEKVTDWGRLFSRCLCTKSLFHTATRLLFSKTVVSLTWLCVLQLICSELRFSKALKSKRIALLLEDFTLSWGFYGFGLESVIFTARRRRCEIMQKLAIWTWFRRSRRSGLQILRMDVCRIGRSVSYLLQLNTSSNISEQCSFLLRSSNTCLFV